MVEFNRKIERQLDLLDKFWSLPENTSVNWSSNSPLQERYYLFMKENNFIENKDAPRKDKDARQKTSGLVDLGLIDEERRLTDAGKALLAISKSGNFAGDNIFGIAGDSYIYLKQLMKLSYPFDNGPVRPFLVLAYALLELDKLSKDEFKYLLPLITDSGKAQYIIDCIRKVRDGILTVDDIITEVVMSLSEYQVALSEFMDATVIDESVIDSIAMNRKSTIYNQGYLLLYHAFEKGRSCWTNDAVKELYDAVYSLSGKAQTYWKAYLFKNTTASGVTKLGTKALRLGNPIFAAKTEDTFRKVFFTTMHLFKAKSLLDDYYDLNRRYFKTCDAILFQDDTVKFDILPDCYFTIIQPDILRLAFTEDENLYRDCTLEEMDDAFGVQEWEILNKAQEKYGQFFESKNDIQKYVDAERQARFNKLIDTKFTDEVLINLLTLFEERDDNKHQEDKKIQEIVTDNADAPTIFEYVLAISWHKISDRRGNILASMNLSLDADLLPVTHAAGGHEDITYMYSASKAYPAHTLLLEVTLSSKTNQRRMEMEPVSRHMGDYIIAHPRENAYCLFVASYLHINVIADFRQRKTYTYYSDDGTKSLSGMKIITLDTGNLKTIIKKHRKYEDLYAVFEDAYNSSQYNGDPKSWYENEIVAKL
ncbi:MAG: AlwI family type II restriction endonuclease [Clostridia bacterium]|nr:AlwI family type II restriction endonuclease [Clostridia bacterium]